MKILYDHQIFSLQKYGGISRYFFMIMNGLYQMNRIEFDLPVYFSHNQYLRKAPFTQHKTFFPEIRFGLKNYLEKWLKSKNQKMAVESLKKESFDIFHPTFFGDYFLEPLGRRPFVLTVHDMIHSIYPQLFKKDNPVVRNTENLARQSSAVIAVSENTKADIIRFYGIDREKVKVIHHGAPFSRQSAQKIRSKINLPFKYILFVGIRRNYKNFIPFIQSITGLMQKENIHVVCAGGGQFSGPERGFFKENNIEGSIHFIRIQNDDELISLYKQAELFAYPSLYEGFGLPILEAFACGCPAALSNRSSFPEVAGEAAAYFNPEDQGSMHEAVAQLLENKEQRKILTGNGYRRLEYFSWDRTVEKTVSVYTEVLSAK
ncbi:MAG: glycosyltransferase family 1 protein [Calditrichia bacterium]